MELAILIILIVVVIFYFRRFSNFVYLIGIMDIFLRILNFIKLNIGIPEIGSFINRYFPSSIPAILDKYSSGVLNTILMWAYVIIFIIFEGYVIRTFFRKKK